MGVCINMKRERERERERDEELVNNGKEKNEKEEVKKVKNI